MPMIVTLKERVRSEFSAGGNRHKYRRGRREIEEKKKGDLKGIMNGLRARGRRFCALLEEKGDEKGGALLDGKEGRLPARRVIQNALEERTREKGEKKP